MDTHQTSPQLQNLLSGLIVSRALQVAAEFGVADALAGGPKHSEPLAREVGADTVALPRLLRALASVRVFEGLPDGRFANTPQSELLRGDLPESLRGLARMFGDSVVWQAWTGLEHSVRSGEPGFAYVHGSPMFKYLETHPDSARRFDEAMASLSGAMNRILVQAYEWSRFSTLVDIAGGSGSTLAAILEANPKVSGVLFDLPHVIERARSYRSPSGLMAQCRTEAGSFFETVPAGADGYFMKHIIHDWSDQDCLRILSVCRRTMPDNAKLLVCERIILPGNAPSPAKIADLTMLVMTDGGCERTEREFRQLFERVGLRLGRVFPAGDHVIMELTK